MEEGLADSESVGAGVGEALELGVSSCRRTIGWRRAAAQSSASSRDRAHVRVRIMDEAVGGGRGGYQIDGLRARTTDIARGKCVQNDGRQGSEKGSNDDGAKRKEKAITKYD